MCFSKYLLLTIRRLSRKSKYEWVFFSQKFFFLGNFSNLSVAWRWSSNLASLFRLTGASGWRKWTFFEMEIDEEEKWTELPAFVIVLSHHLPSKSICVSPYDQEGVFSSSNHRNWEPNKIQLLLPHSLIPNPSLQILSIKRRQLQAREGIRQEWFDVWIGISALNLTQLDFIGIHQPNSSSKIPQT